MGVLLGLSRYWYYLDSQHQTLGEEMNMGTGTTVNLTIRAADQQQFELICDGYCGKYKTDTGEQTQVAIIEYTFDDVKYTNLELEDELQKRKIPYDKNWSFCSEFLGGCQYHRIDNTGANILKRFSDGEEDQVSFQQLEEALLNDDLDTFMSQERERLYIMSWEDQDKTLKTKERIQ